MTNNEKKTPRELLRESLEENHKRWTELPEWIHKSTNVCPILFDRRNSPITMDDDKVSREIAGI